MQYNTFTDVEMLDGTTVKCTLTYGHLLALKTKNKEVFDSYNKVASKGAKDEFDNLRIVYTGYLCGLLADNKPIEQAMSFESFIDAVLPDRILVAEAMMKLFAPKKAMASAVPFNVVA